MEPIDTADAFKAQVAQFSEAHAEQTRVAGTLRDMRKRTKEMQAGILTYMQDNGIDECALGHCRLVRRQTKRTEALKKEHIEGELRRVLPEGVDEAMTNMYNRRVTDVKETVAVVAAENT